MVVWAIHEFQSVESDKWHRIQMRRQWADLFLWFSLASISVWLRAATEIDWKLRFLVNEWLEQTIGLERIIRFESFLHQENGLCRKHKKHFQQNYHLIYVSPSVLSLMCLHQNSELEPQQKSFGKMIDACSMTVWPGVCLHCGMRVVRERGGCWAAMATDRLAETPSATWRMEYIIFFSTFLFLFIILLNCPIDTHFMLNRIVDGSWNVYH